MPSLWERIRQRLHHQSKVLKHNYWRCPRNPELTRLSVKKISGTWYVSDDKDGLFVAALPRWRRYRRGGVRKNCEAVALTYGHGSHFQPEAGQVILDIGANVGEFSLHCLWQGASVIAVEADRKVFAILEQNLKDQADAVCVNAAIAAQDGQMTFYSSVEKADSSLVRPEVVDEEYDIDAMTIATLMERRGLGRIDLIKCDAEGAEPEVIKGALPVLGRVHKIAIDCGAERQGEATDAIVGEMLENAGFDIRIGDVEPARRVVWATNRNWPPKET